MIVTLEPCLNIFEEMAMEYVNSRMEEKMSKVKAEIRTVGNELFEVIIWHGTDRRYMGNAATTRVLAKEHALNTAKNLLVDAQQRLIKAQTDAIMAREIVESIEALATVHPKGWDSVGTDTPQI